MPILFLTVTGKHAVIAVEVGWTETVEKLVADAERLINGTHNAIDVVILIKVYETKPIPETSFPGGFTPTICRPYKEWAISTS